MFSNDKTTANKPTLLWYGTKLCNWGGILSDGIMFPPKEALDDEFDKGIVFYDVVSAAAKH